MAEIDDRIKFCWVDLETTGLLANEDVPLEFGIKLTDERGYILHEEVWLIKEVGALYNNRIAAAKEHPIVGPMHEKSGLWADLRAATATDAFTRDEADDDIYKWLIDCGVDARAIPMAGNSIGSLDRPFCLVHFPRVAEYLSYRNVDMSSVKEICKAVNPELFENLRPIISNKDTAEHRPLSDIDASILEYRAYCDNFFFTAEEF